jgi:hypothetical protein
MSSSDVWAAINAQKGLEGTRQIVLEGAHHDVCNSCCLRSGCLSADVAPSAPPGRCVTSASVFWAVSLEFVMTPLTLNEVQLFNY